METLYSLLNNNFYSSRIYFTCHYFSVLLTLLIYRSSIRTFEIPDISAAPIQFTDFWILFPGNKLLIFFNFHNVISIVDLKDISIARFCIPFLYSYLVYTVKSSQHSAMQYPNKSRMSTRFLRETWRKKDSNFILFHNKKKFRTVIAG